jgi:uncharacterized protein YecT (DUF1311 family)
MTKIYLTLLCIIIASLGFAQTQADVNYDALQEYKRSDLKLNEVYKNILTAKKSDVVFIQNLKKAQRLWVQYRDAQLAIKYPPQKEEGYYKSVLPMLQASFLTEVTIQRIGDLEGLIEPALKEKSKNSWSGLWYGSASKESSILIKQNQQIDNSYSLLCKGPNGEWEGLAYEFGNQLIAVFRYRNNDEKGYFTLTMNSPMRTEFSTYNSDGSYRASGTLVKN